jgi:hypothetical protein
MPRSGAEVETGSAETGSQTDVSLPLLSQEGLADSGAGIFGGDDGEGSGSAAVACDADSVEEMAFRLPVSSRSRGSSDAPHSAQKRLILLLGASQTGQIRLADEVELMGHPV